MSLAYSVVTGFIKRAIHILCRVDDAQVAAIPAQGPLILATNHINFLEAPLLYTYLQPRAVVGFVKAQTWDHPLFGPLATLWDAIPVHRGEADTGAFRQALAALRAGKILAVAPEGTRSGDGRLQKGYPGIVLLALHSRAPVLPVAHYGGEQFWENLRRVRRTDVRIAVGRPYRIELGGQPATQAIRNALADDVMRRIAALLPPAYHGVYAGQAGMASPYARAVEG